MEYIIVYHSITVYVDGYHHHLHTKSKLQLFTNSIQVNPMSQFSFNLKASKVRYRRGINTV